MDINSLPPVRQDQIEIMNRNAEKMMAEQGITVPHPEIAEKAQASRQEDKQAWQLAAPVELTYGASPEPETQEIDEPEADHSHDEETGEIIQESPKSMPPSMAKRKTPAESFSELKAKAERLERENLEMMRKLYEGGINNNQARQQAPKIEQPEEEDLDFKVADDDLVDGKVANKLKKTFKQQQQELREQKQQIQNMMIEQRLKNQYPDFDKVVSKDNIALLAHRQPFYAAAIDAVQDLEKKAEMAYAMIKNEGIYQEPVMTPEKRRIQENANKPRLSPAVAAQQQGESPLNKANMFAEGLTPELMKQLNRETQLSRKGY